MKIPVLVFGLILASSATAAEAESTDFGVRMAPGAPSSSASVGTTMPVAQAASSVSSTSLSAAVAVLSRLGRVTSTRRSVAHNRRVGGVRNSHHIYGRAVDVVPRPGVRHSDLEVALRRAGFHLIESLNEGDHSHFAFGSRPAYKPSFRQAVQERKELTDWGLRVASR